MAVLTLSAQICIIALVVAHPWSESYTKGRLRVDFLDVGQGDAALITFPEGTTLLVDGGGQPGPFKKRGITLEEGEESSMRESRRIGETVVSEYLWSRGLNHVDYILATHADADHIDGLNDVARNFPVRAALVARAPARDSEFAEFNRTLNSRNIPLRLIGAGDEIQVGDVTIRVLWPTAVHDSALRSGNNESVVLQLEYGSTTILMTGDIEGPAEKSLLAGTTNLSADVVKVAHHGSKTSSLPGFIAATRARFAVISVGQRSIFGHPNKDVVERWRANGAQVLTTGKSGMITVTADGGDLKVSTFLGSGK